MAQAAGKALGRQAKQLPAGKGWRNLPAGGMALYNSAEMCEDEKATGHKMEPIGGGR